MSGGGSGLVQELENGFGHQWDMLTKNPLGWATNEISLGTVDANSGKFDLGNFAPLHAVDEIVGAVSGRNAARYQASKTQESINAADATFQQQQADQQLQNYRADVAASRSAAAIRSTANARAGGPNFIYPGAIPPSIQVNKLGNEQNTLLGI